MINPTIKMLEVGAGKFSFVTAFLDKKKQNGQLIPEITATEIVVEEFARKDPKTVENIKRAECFISSEDSPKVKFLFEVDATKLDIDNRLEARYHAIRFNMPHNRAPFCSGGMQALIADFFKTAATKQQIKDKIYLAIPQPYNFKPDGSKKTFEEGAKSSYYYLCYYNVYSASANAGYKLITKRNFSKMHGDNLELRYPGYEHTITSDNRAAESAKNAREYVFEKTDLTPDQIRQQSKALKANIYQMEFEYHDKIDTDNESDANDFEYLKEDQISKPGLSSQSDFEQHTVNGSDIDSDDEQESSSAAVSSKRPRFRSN